MSNAFLFIKRHPSLALTTFSVVTIAGIIALYKIELFAQLLAKWERHDLHLYGESVVSPPPADMAWESRLAELRRLDKTDPPGIAHVPEYSHRGLDGRHSWNTNMAELWSGVWKQASNGLRVQLQFYQTNSPDACVVIQVGSTVSNSGQGWMPSPDRRFLRFELKETNGVVLDPKWRAAARAYDTHYTGNVIIRPSRWLSWLNTSLQDSLPSTIFSPKYPRFKDGSLVDHIGFLSNGPPCQIAYFRFNDVYSISQEGDYIFSVCPTLYRMRDGTNENVLSRIDLPTVTAKVHLMPP